MLDRLVAVHAAAARLAPPDRYAVTRRVDLELALAGVAAASSGPYTRPAAEILTRNGAVRALLARYDDLVARCGKERPGLVLTHGEPHPGNTMLGPEGWLLIDWDTALATPPERDLWLVDPGDGSVLDAYAEAAGMAPRPWLARLYRIRWDLADIALAAAGFREPHAGDADDAESFAVLRDLLDRIAG